MTDWTKDEPRPPILPATVSEFLRRRSAEAIGLGFLAVGAAAALMLATHDVNDPSWFNATSAPARNALGPVGAFIADPLMRTLGLASWGIPAVLLVWAWRLIAHRGEGRIWSRVALSPIALVAGAMFASAHAPHGSWPFEAGLGGLIGDGGLSGLLGLVPGAPASALFWATPPLGLCALLLAALALGIDGVETRAAGRWLWSGLRDTSRGLFGLTGASAERAIGAARDRLARPRSEKVAPPPPVGAARRIEPRIDDEDDDAGAAPPSATALGAALAATRGDAPVRPAVSRPKPSPKPKLSRRAEAERQPSLALLDVEETYDAPALSLLESPTTIQRRTLSEEALAENARMLETVLDDYGVRGEITAVKPGPVVTMYELEPAPGLKASRVIGLADDIARSMSALAARVSTVPGRSVIGIELPNDFREKVLLREMLSSPVYGDANYPLALALGKDIGGDPVIANLAKMPHLLIAGTTGSGKSVGINTMILSLLYRLSPKQCRLIMIDPKMLELSVYDGIPHLLSPVVTDPKKAVVALKWAVAEMEDRYRKMSKMGVRNIDGYNGRVRAALDAGEAFSRTVQTGFDEDTGQPILETEEFEPEEMPFIVVIVDEMADLMMVAGKEIEACIQRLAQMARASGIHIVMATQRPSVDVITGTIKANFPTRISFQVTSKVDSRTILGEQGAEQLLGMGDMLYMAGGGRVTRVHGPFVSDEEVEEVVRHLKTLGQPDYVSAVTEGGEDDEREAAIDEILGLGGDGDENALYDQAVMIVARDRKASTSYIQRKLQIGYNRAARLIEQMEDQGVVSPANHVGKREVLIEER